MTACRVAVEPNWEAMFNPVASVLEEGKYWRSYCEVVAQQPNVMYHWENRLFPLFPALHDIPIGGGLFLNNPGRCLCMMQHQFIFGVTHFKASFMPKAVTEKSNPDATFLNRRLYIDKKDFRILGIKKYTEGNMLMIFRSRGFLDENPKTGAYIPSSAVMIWQERLTRLLQQ